MGWGGWSRRDRHILQKPGIAGSCCQHRRRGHWCGHYWLASKQKSAFIFCHYRGILLRRMSRLFASITAKAHKSSNSFLPPILKQDASHWQDLCPSFATSFGISLGHAVPPPPPQWMNWVGTFSFQSLPPKPVGGWSSGGPGVVQPPPLRGLRHSFSIFKEAPSSLPGFPGASQFAILFAPSAHPT